MKKQFKIIKKPIHTITETPLHKEIKVIVNSRIVSYIKRDKIYLKKK